jgi:hypothetical protein
MVPAVDNGQKSLEGTLLSPAKANPQSNDVYDFSRLFVAAGA